MQSLDEASGSISSTTPSPSVTPPSTHSNKSSPGTPTRPYSPTITTPTVNIPSTVKFTSPKTSPLLMSNSSKSPKSGPRTSHMEHGNKIQLFSTGQTSQTSQTGQTSLGGLSSQTPLVNSSQPHISATATRNNPKNPSSVVSGGQNTCISANLPPYQPGRSILKPAQHPFSHPSVSLGNQPSLKLPDPPQQTAHSNHQSAQPPPLSSSVPQYTSSIPQYSFGIPQYISMNPLNFSLTNPPPLAPSQGSQPTVAQQQMEYQAAMELEMWKMAQEQAFMKELK